ncbi:LysR family transcriptional regulator [Ramlibacter sp. G-1-2-2]|uniref:LysR family transcriptional regulator n=1 Tax=Ramlibacter agri TaxID=2728837 RepID=A0A848HCC6_9BURK|nr:LysR family transcriptional regulator [Ramlibacter agri]NML47120.1 LysR family transcriptional regulator [Ramlibacter agri]
MIYPNPRHLRAFAALADSGSFGAAAEAVHLGQPALSQAIAKLEDVVGVRLIERTTRSVRLTPAGEEFLVEARRVLDAYERMMLRGSEWAQLRRGRVDLFTVPSIAHRLLPALVREFTAEHPEVSVEVHDHADPVLRQRLDRGEGDLAMLTQSSSAAPQALLPFLRDRFRVVLPSNHPLARQESIDAAQLIDERLILLRRGALFRSYMDAAISGLPLVHPPIEVDQASTLNGMVEGGLGVTLLPALSCPTPALRSVTSRPLTRPEVFRLIAFELPADREPMPAVQAFVHGALQYLEAHVDQLPEGCELLPASAQRVKKFLAARPAAPSAQAVRSRRAR